MKKRMACVSLTLIMAGILLAGCSNGSKGGGTDAENVSTEAKNEEKTDGSSFVEEQPEKDELVNIVWEWVSYGDLPSGFQDVEDKLNEMTERDIGVHVTLEPVLRSDLQNQTTMLVSSGEQVDLAVQVGTGVAPYVSSGLILPLDDYIDEYGKNIKEECGDQLYGGMYQGKLYGVPIAYMNGESYGYVARKDILDKYNIEITDGKLYTIEELEDIFATVKAGEGDKFYMQIPDASYPILAGSYFEYDKLGGTIGSGVLMLNRSFDDLTVNNLYETDEYREYAERMYDWANKGYISSDASTNTESRNDLLVSGNYLGYFTYSTPNNLPSIESSTGLDLVMIDILEPYVVKSAATVSWQVPITTVSPEKAIETLNYIYAHPEAANLLQWGIEGESYEVIEENENGQLIRYLAEDTSTLPYLMKAGVYGNRLKWPIVEPSSINMNKELKDWDAAIPDSRKSPAMGYIFDMDSVSTEFSAVAAVISQYEFAIDCGAMNPEEALPEFQEALKAAGIDKIIAENQRQLDAWAAAQ